MIKSLGSFLEVSSRSLLGYLPFRPPPPSNTGGMPRSRSKINDIQEESFSASESVDGAQSTLDGSIKKASARFKDEKLNKTTIDLDAINDVSNQYTEIGDPETTVLGNYTKRRTLSSRVSSRIRQVSSGLKRYASSRSFSKGANMNKAATARALKGLQFVTQSVFKSGWAGVEAKFDKLAEDGLLPRIKFGQCIGMLGSDEFGGQLFDTLTRRTGIMSTSITKDQLHELWNLLSDQRFESRVQTFFEMVDKNGDGKITEEEVKGLIILSASANKLLKIRDRADEYTALIMEELDPDHIGHVEIESLKVLLLEAPTEFAVSEDDHCRLIELLGKKLVQTTEPNRIKKLNYFIEDHWKQIWVITVWILINIALFTWKFIQFERKIVFKVLHYCVSVAKGGAEICKFNMALILLTVCRNSITWLRSKTKLASIVPFDDNINFHKMVAVAILVGIILHAGPHTACNIPSILHASNEDYQYIKKFFGEPRPPSYWWFLTQTEGFTGVWMLVLMAIAIPWAMPSFRRKQHKLPGPLNITTGYNSFWYTHHLFTIVYVLYSIHGYRLFLTDVWYEKTTWMYLAGPLLLYTSELLTRVYRAIRWKVKIFKVTVYPSPGDAIELHMSKPKGFKYSSGQYLYLKCINISRLQWHPFSITSAPDDAYISVHIRALGDWTSEFRDLFTKAIQPPTAARNEILRADMTQGNFIPGLPEICLDGPFGAPSQDYKNYDVLLLIGLGIGATPLISIVKDVLYHIKQRNDMTEGKLEAGTTNCVTNRAYFYWVTREEGSFEWFKGVLNDVAGIDKDKVIEIHNHCTSVYGEGDARSALIGMIQSLHHAKTGVDIVSGAKVKTHFARPNWCNVFKDIATKHPDQRVGVFYCGDRVLVRLLTHLSHEFSRRTLTKFEFHKENF